MVPFLLDDGFELCAGLAMDSAFRANDRINLYPAAPIHQSDHQVRQFRVALLDGIHGRPQHRQPFGQLMGLQRSPEKCLEPILVRIKEHAERTSAALESLKV